MKIYVASSWRNEFQPGVVETLRKLGHEVYDFKNPQNGGENSGFKWSEIDPNWRDWTPKQFADNLDHPISQKGFDSDFDAMIWADVCVLVLPCGRSAHTEAGWMKGRGKPVFVYIPVAQEPELMYKVYDLIIGDMKALDALFTNLTLCPQCGCNKIGLESFNLTPDDTDIFCLNKACTWSSSIDEIVAKVKSII